ncbi:hypothetical protein [Vibrio scophthalmi]|uniref:Uncharacterized protein n=1 Tax=Vibrio scophthalmi TaxID=45658 RepID=A0A1E3WK55_9VIBR|nr:hypothetical protein [Vibrio scophthalmi]ODS10153.1 hypothetical protein VSF3289_00408 [Vibrio scophthalmi]
MTEPTTKNWELSEEELALSAQLDAIDTPEETAQAGELEPQSDALGAQEIAMCTTVLMKGFEKASQVVLKNPYLTIPTEAIDTISPKVEAVANKYDITAPEFLAKWREEIELGMTLAGIGYGIYQQHLSIKAQLELQAKAQAQGGEDGKEAA